jgi:hypothetical protein
MLPPRAQSHHLYDPKRICLIGRKGCTIGRGAVRSEGRPPLTGIPCPCASRSTPAPPTSLYPATDSSCAASGVFGCRHTAGGLIEVATLMFGDAAVDDLVRVYQGGNQLTRLQVRISLRSAR